MSRSLQFDIVANDKASAKLKDVQGIAGQFAKSLTGMFAGFFTIEAILGRITSLVTEAFSWGSSLKESAAGIGLSVKELQQLEYAAGQTGVEAGKLQKAFLDLRKTVRDASQGGVEQAKVLRSLGYTQEEVASGNIDIMDAFLKVSRAMSSATTEQEKFNIATSIFGDKIALDMIRVMSDFGELKQIISETPLISDQDAERLDRMADKADRISAVLRALSARSIANAADIGLTAAGATGVLARGAMEMLGQDKRPGFEPTQADKDAAAALGKFGKGGAAGAGMKGPEVSQLATIGGAAGFRAGVAKTPELNALEQIEANTRPRDPVPANGSTDFSKPAATPSAPAPAPAPQSFGQQFLAGARKLIF